MPGLIAGQFTRATCHMIPDHWLTNQICLSLLWAFRSIKAPVLAKHQTNESQLRIGVKFLHIIFVENAADIPTGVEVIILLLLFVLIIDLHLLCAD